VAGLMGLPIAVAVLCIGDIKRKFQNSMDTSDFRKYLRIHARAIFGLYSAFAIQSAGVVALSTWIPTYLTRRFEISAAEVGEGIGKAVISGSILGILLSLAFTRWFYPKFGRRSSYIIYFGGVLAAMIPTLLQLTAKDAEMTLWLTFVTVSLLTMASGHTASMLQDVSPSQLRGRVFAIATLFMSVIPSAAPALVGLISDGWADSNMGLIQAICTVTTTCFLLSGLVLYISRNSIIFALNDLRAA
jgi:MFS family permease